MNNTWVTDDQKDLHGADRLSELCDLRQDAAEKLAREDQRDAHELALYALGGYVSDRRLRTDPSGNRILDFLAGEGDKGSALKRETGDLDVWILKGASPDEIKALTDGKLAGGSEVIVDASGRVGVATRRRLSMTLAFILIPGVGIVAAGQLMRALVNHWINTNQAALVSLPNISSALQFLGAAMILPMVASAALLWAILGYVGDFEITSVSWVDNANPLPKEARLRLRQALSNARAKETEARAIIGAGSSSAGHQSLKDLSSASATVLLLPTRRVP